jgi:transcription antitermination factor NusG
MKVFDKILMNNNNQEIKSIVEQLQRLQIKQATLLTRLERVSEGGGDDNEETPTARRAGLVTRDRPRELAIGDQVKIRNPGPFQATKGTIIKINLTTDYITVQATNGTKIVRARKNVILQTR